MRLIGNRVLPHLTLAYAISGAIAGLAGALFTQANAFVGLGVLSLDTSVDVLVMLVLGGIGSLYGALIGAPVYMLLKHFSSQWNPFYWMLMIGVLLDRGGAVRPRRVARARCKLDRPDCGGPGREPRTHRTRGARAVEAVRRPARHAGRQPDAAGRCPHGADRAEWRGQDDAGQPAHGRAAAPTRANCTCSARR